VDILEQLGAKSKRLMKEVDGQALLFGLCSRSGFTEQTVELAKKRSDVLLYDWKAIVDQ
jgi:hypothetical protein